MPRPLLAVGLCMCLCLATSSTSSTSSTFSAATSTSEQAASRRFLFAASLHRNEAHTQLPWPMLDASVDNASQLLSTVAPEGGGSPVVLAVTPHGMALLASVPAPLANGTIAQWLPLSPPPTDSVPRFEHLPLDTAGVDIDYARARAALLAMAPGALRLALAWPGGAIGFACTTSTRPASAAPLLPCARQWHHAEALGDVAEVHIRTAPGGGDPAVFVAAQAGLFTAPWGHPTGWARVAVVAGPASALAVSAHALAVCMPHGLGPPMTLHPTAAVGGAPQPRTNSSLLIQSRATGAWQRFWLGGILDANCTALAFDEAGTLWVADEVTVSWAVPRRPLDAAEQVWSFERLSGLVQNPGSSLGGLALPSTTTIAALPTGVWLGGAHGLLRFPTEASQATDQLPPPLCLTGPRFLPSLPADPAGSVAVRSVASYSNSFTVALTARGVAFTKVGVVPLPAKASLYEAMVPRHNRSRLYSDAQLPVFGDVAAPRLGCGESDGLWSSLLLASLSLKHGAAPDDATRLLAWDAFAGLELLHTVTGVPGLIARTAGRAGDPGCGQPACAGGSINKCFLNSTAMPGWLFMSSLSSDSLMGHMLAYPLMHLLVAATPQEKARVAAAHISVVDYILDHDLYLYDVDGKPTNWGVWNPRQLNNDSAWFEETGLNSAQILAMLYTAGNLTGDPKYTAAAADLVATHGYGRNIVNQRITAADDVNFSDDELAFMALYLIELFGPPEIRPYLGMSLDRSCRIASPEQSSLFNLVCALGKGDAAPAAWVADATRTLQRWPLELVDWPINASIRIDVTENSDDPEGIRQLLPPDERPLMKWNANPYRPAGGSGHAEHGPGAFLLPYWLGRFHSLL